jgi:hypothetical protein
MGKNLLTGIGLIKKSRQWDEKEINTKWVDIKNL